MRLTSEYCFSWVLVTFGPCYAIVQPPMVLRQDHMEIIERSEKIQELNPMISCVEIIAKKWFINKERVPLLIPNFLENPGLSKPFFTRLQKEVATLSVAEDFQSFENYQKTHSAVIVVRNSTDLYLLNDLKQLCAPRCRYLVCLLTFYKDEESLLLEADAVVKALWKTWIVNAVIVASAAGKFVVAGSYSFESNTYRVPNKPEILGECGTLSTKTNEYIFHKLLMNDSLVNVTVSNCPPYVEFPNEEVHEVITGMEADMFEEVAKSLHISLNRLNASVDTNSTIYESLESILANPDENDLVFCGLYYGYSPRVEYSITYEAQEIVWLVPALPALSLLGLVTPLQNFVWFAIIGLLILTGIMKVFLFSKLSFLDVLGLILGVALPRQPTSLSNRIQFASWVFFGYVITQSYLASLAGQLMNTNSQMIETMEQLENSGISYGGADRHRNLFKDDGNLVSRRIYDKYQTLSPAEYEETLTDMLAGKNTSIALVFEIKISRVAAVRTGPYDPHKLDETLASYPVALAAWKGLPYLDQIDVKVSQLTEAGLINFWSKNYANRTSSMVEIKVSGELDMLHLSPSFLLLLFGHGLGLLVFLIEIGVYTRRNRRLRRRNKVDKKFK